MNEQNIKEKLYVAERLTKDAARLGACPASYQRITRASELLAETKALMELEPRRFTTV